MAIGQDRQWREEEKMPADVRRNRQSSPPRPPRPRRGVSRNVESRFRIYLSDYSSKRPHEVVPTESEEDYGQRTAEGIWLTDGVGASARQVATPPRAPAAEVPPRRERPARVPEGAPPLRAAGARARPLAASRALRRP